MKSSSTTWTLGLAAGLVALVGCATGAGGSDDDGLLQRNVGMATQFDLTEKTMLVVRQNQFLIEREEYDGIFYVETRWRDRQPFADERALGLDAAQSRLIVRGQPRAATTPDGQFYSVTVIVENRVSARDGEGWRTNVSTRQFREYAQRITEDLRRELEIGVRRFGPDSLSLR